MRNRLNPPYYINRASKWAQGLDAWFPLNIDTDSSSNGSTFGHLEVKNGIRFYHTDVLSGPFHTKVITGPNGEYIRVWNTTTAITAGRERIPIGSDFGFTMSVWMKIDSNPFTEVTIYDTDGLAFNVLSGPQFKLFGSSSFTPNIVYGQWHHVLWTVESVDPADPSFGRSRVYLDGNLIDDRISTLARAKPRSSTYITYVNSAIANGTAYDMRIYNYAWSPDQVMLFYGNRQERIDLFGPKRSIGIHSAIQFLSSSMNLHMIGTIDKGLGLDLYISGEPSPISGSIDLHTLAILPASGTTDLYTSGEPVPYSGNINLYVRGHEAINSSIDLYTYGHDISNSGINLYIRGLDSISSSAELYIEGMLPCSGAIDLYTYGIETSFSPVNLFIKTPTGVNSNDSIDLYSYSTTNSGLFETQDLFVKNTQQHDPRNAVTLFVKGPTGFDSENVTLFVQNQQRTFSSVNFYVNGPIPVQSSGVNLYITTPNAGTSSDGYTPVSDAVNLFVARDSEGMAGTVNLYMKAPEPIYSSVNIIISGAIPVTNTINLVIEGSGIPAPISNNVGFYMRGGE